jgi:hypothetical protein
VSGWAINPEIGKGQSLWVPATPGGEICGWILARLWQEIYDDGGTLVEVHQKYPTDTGHQKI